MTERPTRPSPRQLQLFLVSGGKISLTLQPQLQRKTAGTSLLYVYLASACVSQLIAEGAPIAIHVTTHDGQPKVIAAVRGLPAAILHSFAAGEFPDAATSGHVGAAAVSFCRIVHRVRNFWSKLPHALTRPL